MCQYNPTSKFSRAWPGTSHAPTEALAKNEALGKALSSMKSPLSKRSSSRMSKDPPSRGLQVEFENPISSLSIIYISVLAGHEKEQPPPVCLKRSALYVVVAWQKYRESRLATSRLATLPPANPSPYNDDNGGTDGTTIVQHKTGCCRQSPQALPMQWWFGDRTASSDTQLY